MAIVVKPRVERSIGAVLALVAALAVPVDAIGADDEAPVLVSKTGGATSKWKTLADVQKAAELGEADAALELGSMYEFGREVPENPVRARTLYMQASAGGLAEADFRLGRLLSEGLGGPVDLPAAFERYLRAARAGLPLAQYNVGAMLASGRGVKRDYVEGLAWVILASRDSVVDPEGEKRLRARLARRPQDIAAAEARAKAIEAELKAARETPAASTAKPAAAVAPVAVPAGDALRPVAPVPILPPEGLRLPPPAPTLPPQPQP